MINNIPKCPYDELETMDNSSAVLVQVEFNSIDVGSRDV